MLYAAGIFHSSSESLSYRDGYATGKSGYPVIWFEGAYNTAYSQCEDNVNVLLPPNDNAQQWVEGCEAGWNAANFKSNHPGAG
jgi:hypothetical protein